MPADASQIELGKHYHLQRLSTAGWPSLTQQSTKKEMTFESLMAIVSITMTRESQWLSSVNTGEEIIRTVSLGRIHQSFRSLRLSRERHYLFYTRLEQIELRSSSIKMRLNILSYDTTRISTSKLPIMPRLNIQSYAP